LDPEINGIEGYERRTPLIEAVGKNYFEIAKELIRRGADVHARESYERDTPLHQAARRSDPELVKMLLAKGADPTVKNKYGLTPAEEADKARNEEIAKILRNAIQERQKP
jgi:ankyrin repeat protein